MRRLPNNEKTDSSYGALIRNWRKHPDRNLTQWDCFRQYCGAVGDTWSSFETGRCLPSPRVLALLLVDGFDVEGYLETVFRDFRDDNHFDVNNQRKIYFRKYRWLTKRDVCYRIWNCLSEMAEDKTFPIAYRKAMLDTLRNKMDMTDAFKQLALLRQIKLLHAV